MFAYFIETTAKQTTTHVLCQESRIVDEDEKERRWYSTYLHQRNIGQSTVIANKDWSHTYAQKYHVSLIQRHSVMYLDIRDKDKIHFNYPELNTINNSHFFFNGSSSPVRAQASYSVP
jgi:IMP cyclohydrolase